MFLNDLREFSSESGFKVLFYVLAVLEYETLHPCNLSFEVLCSFFQILFNALIKVLYLSFLSLDFLFCELYKLFKPWYFAFNSISILLVISRVLSLSSAEIILKTAEYLLVELSDLLLKLNQSFVSLSNRKFLAF